MKRIRINPLALLLVALSLAACGKAAEPPPHETEPGARSDAPHLVLIVLDTVRPDHLSTYGYERETSPNLTRLAARGARFDNASSTAAWTHPAHASLLSGTHASEHGARYSGASAPADQPILRPAEDALFLQHLLKRAGYTTRAAVGAPVLAPGFGVTAGFDAFFGARQGEAPDAFEINRRLLAGIDGAAGSRPLFLLVNYFDAHGPYTARPERGPWLATPPAKHQIDLTERVDGLPVFARLAAGTARLEPGARQAAIDNYDSEIALVDAALGELIAALEKRGLLERSVVAITADHGECFGEHGLYDHGRTLYRQLTDVPLVILGKGVSAGTVLREPVQIIDLFPTLLAAAGAAIPGSNRGVSLWPLLRGEAGFAPHPIAAEAFADPAVAVSASIYNRDYRSFTRDGIKLIVSDPPAGHGQLYDLKNDPDERDNLATDRLDDTARLSAALDAWLPRPVAEPAHP